MGLIFTVIKIKSTFEAKNTCICGMLISSYHCIYDNNGLIIKISIFRMMPEIRIAMVATLPTRSH